MGQPPTESDQARSGRDVSHRDLASFHEDLIALRVAAGAPSYARIARQIGQPRTTVYDAFRRRSLPSLELLTALVIVLRGDPAQWRDRWAQLRVRVDAGQRTSAEHALQGAAAAIEPDASDARTVSDDLGREPFRRAFWLAIAAAVVTGAMVAGVIVAFVTRGADSPACTHYRAYRLNADGALLAKDSTQTGRVAVGDVVLVATITDHTFRARYPAVDVMTGKRGYVDEQKLTYLHDSCV